jgi:hypothetical protein
MDDPSQQFDTENADTINLSDGRKLSVYWTNELFGSAGDPRRLMEKRRLSAITFSSRGQKLLVWTEPTLDDRIGIAIHNDCGKVLFTGIGDVIYGSHGPEFISFGSAEYAWRNASPSGCAHTDWAKKKKKN